jgi:hypothetical protein
MATVIVKMQETGEQVPIKPGDMIDNKLVRKIRVYSFNGPEDMAMLVFDDGTESDPFDVVRVLY